MKGDRRDKERKEERTTETSENGGLRRKDEGNGNRTIQSPGRPVYLQPEEVNMGRRRNRCT